MNEKILGDLKGIFEISDDFKLDHIALDSYSNWNSFNIIQMLEMVESEYGASLTLEELKQFVTMQNVYDWIERKIR